MRTPFRAALSRTVGWLADRRIPRPLRAPVYRSYARFTGADLSEVKEPLADHASLGAFFVRTLCDGVRPVDPDARTITSPCDGTIQAVGPIERGSLLQAKGHSYSLAELLGSAEDARDGDGGSAWTIYLSPRDYHRVHVPAACTLAAVRRIPGARYSVAPGVLARRLVLPINERAVFRLECGSGRLWLVMVGATNVGRIRVVGDAELASPPRRFAKAEELARFEMGSTVVLVAPRGVAAPAAGLAAGTSVRLGRAIGAWSAVAATARA
ncbi:MAG TPA: archaetidylserine decarboxylase [Planctomycetota bacterium]|jgi:phosphatidylserine decarboxylase|nr:archaetidylserine decarboxylase [Planctomycetota bacterium]